MQHGNAQRYVLVEFAEVLDLCLLLEVGGECERSDVGLEAPLTPGSNRRERNPQMLAQQSGRPLTDAQMRWWTARRERAWWPPPRAHPPWAVDRTGAGRPERRFQRWHSDSTSWSPSVAEAGSVLVAPDSATPPPNAPTPRGGIGHLRAASTELRWPRLNSDTTRNVKQFSTRSRPGTLRWIAPHLGTRGSLTRPPHPCGLVLRVTVVWTRRQRA
jgi:hypothetical protein